MEQTMNLYLRYDGEGNDLIDTHQHHFEERAVFVGGGVMAVGTNELPVGFDGGEEWVWIVWRGWRNDDD